MTQQADLHQPPSPHSDLVPPGVFLSRLLFLCFFSVFSLVVANGLMLGVDQATETLQAFEGWTDTRYALFLVGFAAWAVSSWYTSRMLIGRIYPTQALGTCTHPGFANWSAAVLPRLLGLMAVVPSLVFFAGRGQWAEAAGILIVGGVFLFFVLIRHRLTPSSQQSQRRWGYFDTMGRPSRIVLWFLGVVPYTVVLLSLTGEPDLLRTVGAPALLLLAFTGWTVFGSMVLIYWPKVHGMSALTWLPFVLYIAFSAFNDNHPVGQTDLEPRPVDRPTLVDDFRAWQTSREQAGLGQEPIYLVAANGGASRSGMWAAYHLASLEDQARKANRPFARNIYAISGISGGSVGASVFASALATQHWVPTLLKNEPPKDIAPQVLAFFKQDHLTPVVSSLLYGDTLARFSPAPITYFDRSRALEKAWQHDWSRVQEGWLREQGMWTQAVQDQACRLSWFARPLEALYQSPWQDAGAVSCHAPPPPPSAGQAAVLLPRLFLNAASMQRGTPVLQAPVRLPPQVPAFDLFDLERFDTARVSLAGAAHNSARFPFISPVGLVRQRQGQAWGHVGDGGYFESSGTWTLAQILNTLERELRDDEWKKLVQQLHIIILDGNPTTHDAVTWLQRSDDKACKVPASEEGRIDEAAHGRCDPPASSLMIELMGPLQGLFSAREGRAAGETRALSLDFRRFLRGVGGGGQAQGELASPSRLFEIRQPAITREEPAMSWFLNKQSMELMTMLASGQPFAKVVSTSAESMGGLAPGAEASWQRFEAQRQALVKQVLTPPAGKATP